MMEEQVKLPESIIFDPAAIISPHIIYTEITVICFQLVTLQQFIGITRQVANMIKVRIGIPESPFL